MFNIEMLPAGHGDSLIIEYGKSANPHYVLIDGGPYYTFNSLKNRIDKLVRENQALDLMIITHIDADHIEGMVKLLGALPENLVINDVWFNGWRHLYKKPADLLGPVHGEMLSALIDEKELLWNKAFNGESILVEVNEPLPCVDLEGGMKLTLLSPTRTGLSKMRRVWAREVRKAGLDPGSPEQALQRLRQSKRMRPPADLLGEPKPKVKKLAKEPVKSDNSVANGSSIAFLAEYEDKRCLFAGDAHPSVLVHSVKKLLANFGERKLRVDAFKLSHHGSKGSLSKELIDLLDCPKYMVSTNGNYYYHPDPEAIAKIIANKKRPVEFFFNYRSEENELWDDGTLRKRFKYKTSYPRKGTEGLTVTL